MLVEKCPDCGVGGGEGCCDCDFIGIRKQREMKALRRELKAVASVLQRYQPAGSPPSTGDSEVLALWVLGELQKRVETAEREALCDVCAGRGDPGTGKSCICGGSGKACDAASNFRVALLKAEAELADSRTALQAERDNLLKQLAAAVQDQTRLIDKAATLRQRLADSEAERVKLVRERDEEEAAHIITIGQRDEAEDGFGLLAEGLGVETEFSNLRGYKEIIDDCAVAQKANVDAATKPLQEKIEALQTERDGLAVTLDGCMEYLSPGAPDVKGIVERHNRALTEPLVKALREVRSHYPPDYKVRITEILDAALAPYEKRPAESGEKEKADAPKD